MNVSFAVRFSDFDSASVPASYLEPHWYAVYTRANHEKRLVPEIQARSLECFLPTYTSVRRWKDRRVSLELPLFPGYLFVRMVLRDRLLVLQIPGVVRLVGFDGQPAALADNEIEILRYGFSERISAEPHPYLKVGHRVRIVNGPLTGLAGILKKRKNALRVVLALDLIQRAVAVDVNATDVVPFTGQQLG